MANISSAYGKGVVYTASIDLGAASPLDSRIAVQTITERDAHITGNRAYPGMQVFVADDNKTYILVDDGEGELVWKTLLDSNSIVNDLTTGGTDKVLSAEQGKALQAQIDQIEGGELSIHAATSSTIGGVLSGGDITVAGNGTVTVNSADAADKLSAARTISLTGDATGSVEFDGSANAEITVTVADDSHNHVIDNVDGLQDALDAKAPIVSPAFTGTPTAPTASAGTNNTQIATTAYVDTAIAEHIADVSGAMIYKGAAASEDDLPSNAQAGWTYRVSTSFELNSTTLDVGDLIVCSGNTSGSAPTWDIYPIDDEGEVFGPSSAVTDNIVVFDGATGKLVKDGGTTIAGLKAELSALATPSTDGTGGSNGMMSAQDKEKLDEIAAGAEVNQNAFSNITAGADPIAASQKTDTLTIAGANGITVSGSGKTVTITGTTYSDATTSQAGLMSAADKDKLDNIAAGAEVNVQADWNQTTTTADDYIKNKPTTMASPYAISITAGSKNVSYDGSSAQSLTVLLSDLGGMPLIDSGTAGHAVVIDTTNNTVKDAGYAIPTPGVESDGMALTVSNAGAYVLKTLGITDIDGLQAALNAKMTALTSATQGNVIAFGANGIAADSGVVAANLIQTTDTVTFTCQLPSA